MRRALSIARYLPAVLCGLLGLAWVVSLWASVSRYESLPGGKTPAVVYFEIHRGNAKGQLVIGTDDTPRWDFRWFDAAEFADPWLGSMDAGWAHLSSQQAVSHGWLYLPFAFLLTLLLPLAIGCLNGFRFPLWSWFAWTALIAVELAYYLR